MSGSNQGNGTLTYPIGLITADEVLLSGTSGGAFDGSYNYQKETPDSYLTTGNSYWTMTPAGYYNPFGVAYWGAHLFHMYPSGNFDDSNANNTYALRPVINIRSDVTVSGDGTIDAPYEFSIG